MRLLLAALIFLSASLLFGSDLKVTEHSTLGRSNWTETTTRWYSGSRSRVESNFDRHLSLTDSLIQTPLPHTAEIYQCDAARVLHVNLDSSEYMTYPLDGNGHFLGARGRRIDEQRKGGTLTISVENRDTGERKQILGHLARHVITTVKIESSPAACSKPREDVTDAWYADLGISWIGCSKDSESRTVLGAMTVAASCNEKVVLRHLGPSESGFPLQSTTTSHGQFVDRGIIHDFTSANTTTVTELSGASLDPALFDLPAGAKQVEHLSPPPQPWTARMLDGLDHLVHAVSSAFSETAALRARPGR